MEEPHTVEVQVLGRDWAILLINGRWVDCVPRADFTQLTGDSRIEVGKREHAGLVAGMSFDRVTAQTRYTDLSRRPLFLQTIAEDIVFAGGCERNDLLDTLKLHRHRLQEMRGTTVGITLEAQRLSCSRDTTFLISQRPAGWYLEINMPTCRNVYLDSSSSFSTGHVELHHNSPNFTPMELAQLLKRYVLPMSVDSMTFQVWVATFLTANSGPSGGNTSFKVVDDQHFEVGDPRGDSECGRHGSSRKPRSSASHRAPSSSRP